jgi:hypothetical protein
MMNGKIRPSGTTEWKSMQYQPKNNFRIQITSPDAVIHEIAGANVQVKGADGVGRRHREKWIGGSDRQRFSIRRDSGLGYFFTGHLWVAAFAAPIPCPRCLHLHHALAPTL